MQIVTNDLDTFLYFQFRFRKMATAQDDSEMVKCPICLEKCTDPRQLLNCGHSFCEACIVTYVGKLVDNNETENGVACPFCRTTSPGPKHRNEITAWIESLEKSINIQHVNRGNDEKENTRSNNNCGSCSIFGISTKATKLCSNCVELLCVSCSMGRHSLRSCRNHKVENLEVDTKGNVNGIDLKTLKTLREYSYCNSHPNMELEYICEEDDHLCCNKCLTKSHRQCKNVKELTGNTLEGKAKSEMETLKQSICKLSIYAQSIIEAKTKNVLEGRKAVEDVPKTLQDIRTKINKLLDTLEETTNEQAKATLKNIELASENDKVTLNEMITSLDDFLCLIDNAVKYGTISQVYAALDKTKEAFRLCEHTICTMADAFKPESPELVIGNSLENLTNLGLNETKSMATMSKKRNDVTLPFYHEFNSLNNANVIRTTTTVVRETCCLPYTPTYNSLIFLLNNQAVMIDTVNGYSSLTNNAYDVIGSRRVKHIRSCSYTKDRKIAVTVNCSNERKIYFLSTENDLKIMNEVTTARKPVSIKSLNNGDIAVGWTDPVAFGIISGEVSTEERVYFTKDKAGRELKKFEYMAIDEGKKHVMQPCTIDNALYCFDFEGNPKFEYRNSDLNGPKGVALDRDGNIFLCSHENSVIHVISPTGRAIKIIREGCPNKPLAIAFKSCWDEFAVTRGHVYGEDKRVVTFFKIQREK